MVYYDSKNPAPGVKVCPSARDKVWLSHSQSKAARKIPTDNKGNYTGRGVIRLKPLGGPLGLDVHSTVRSCPRMLCSTSGPNSGGRPRSPKRGPVNTCFSGHLPTGQQFDKQAGLAELKSLRKMSARLSGYGRPLLNWKGFAESYSVRRVQFMNQHPTLASKLVSIESEHARH